MVNHGVSRACKTCKRRRKKCDEARPSCQRCVKSKRACLGYQDTLDLYFRPHHATIIGSGFRVSPTSLFTPKVPSSSVPECLTPDDTDARLEQQSLSAFFYDYCLAPQPSLHSRGYLNGLKPSLKDADLSSDLAQATKAVALASIGTKLNRPNIVHNARILYSGLLRSLQLKITEDTLPSNTESLMTTVLLGLYEMITATKSHPSGHGSHSRGIYAILSIQRSPIELINRANRCQAGGLFDVPTSDPSIPSLADVFNECWHLLRHAELLLSSTLTHVNDLEQLLIDAKRLNKEFAGWPSSLPMEWKPKATSAKSKLIILRQEYGWLPERADIYLDLYVSTAWNLHRKTRLLINNAIFRCTNRLEIPNSCHYEKTEAENLANDLLASIPFHLFDDFTAYIQSSQNDLERPLVPGKSIGGLLLMHSLYIVSNLAIVSPLVRNSMRECLKWISTYMGIGQAALLQNTPMSFPNESVANSYALILAGMFDTDGDAG